MSELADSTPEFPTACPGCDPTADFERTVVQWCGAHQPDCAGTADGQASPLVGTSFLTGQGEVEGRENKKWCDLFRERR